MCKKCFKMRILFAAVGFVVGSSIGASVMYIFDKKKIKEQDDVIEELLAEINEYDEVNPDKEKSPCLIYLKKDTEMTKEIEESIKDDRTKMSSIIEVQGYSSKIPGGEKPDLASLSAQDSEDDESFDSDEDDVADKILEDSGPYPDEDHEESVNDPSHEIPVDDFLIDADMDKDTVDYYVPFDTGTIVDLPDVFYDKDDDALPIENYMDNVEDFYSAVQKAVQNMKNVIYWRCPKLNLDLEIVINLDTENYDDFERGGYEKYTRRKPKKSERE